MRKSYQNKSCQAGTVHKNYSVRLPWSDILWQDFHSLIVHLSDRFFQAGTVPLHFHFLQLLLKSPLPYLRSLYLPFAKGFLHTDIVRLDFHS